MWKPRAVVSVLQEFYAEIKTLSKSTTKTEIFGYNTRGQKVTKKMSCASPVSGMSKSLLCHHHLGGDLFWIQVILYLLRTYPLPHPSIWVSPKAARGSLCVGLIGCTNRTDTDLQKPISQLHPGGKIQLLFQVSWLDTGFRVYCWHLVIKFKTTLKLTESQNHSSMHSWQWGASALVWLWQMKTSSPDSERLLETSPCTLENVSPRT